MVRSRQRFARTRSQRLNLDVQAGSTALRTAQVGSPIAAAMPTAISSTSDSFRHRISASAQQAGESGKARGKADAGAIPRRRRAEADADRRPLPCFRMPLTLPGIASRLRADESTPSQQYHGVPADHNAAERASTRGCGNCVAAHAMISCRGSGTDFAQRRFRRVDRSMPIAGTHEPSWG